MTLLDKLVEDAKTAPKTFNYKWNSGLLTLADQEEALTKPYWAYLFALNIKGADIERCQDLACKDPHWAYRFALDIKGANIEKCQEGACKHPEWAYMFARDIKGANIEICQEVCKGTRWEF